MSSEFFTTTLPYLVVVVVSVLVFSYAAFLSLSVWRGLSVPIYRSRALWTGLLAVGLAMTTPIYGNESILFPGNLYALGLVLIFGFITPAIILGLYIWIDRTITTLVRLDYLRRDLAWWSKVRFVYWAFALVQFAFYFGVFFNPFFAPPSAGVATLVTGLYFIFWLGPVVYGSLAILIGSRQTTDRTFKTYAKWIGYTFMALIFLVLTSFSTNVAIAYAPYPLFAYCFYKVARNLVPTGKFRTDQGAGR